MHFYNIGERIVWEILVNDGLTLHNWARSKVQFSDCILKHPNNKVPYFEDAIIGSVDTVPVYVKAYQNGYQPKYAADVVKFLPFFRGFEPFSAFFGSLFPCKIL